MIAPARPPQPPTSLPSQTLRRARRLVADMFLPAEQRPAPRRVPAWQSWLMAAWMAGALAAFAAIVVLGGTR